MENDNSFEDVPAVPEEMFNQTHNPLESDDLFAVNSSSLLWRSGKVYYRYATDVSTYHKSVIRSTMDYYEDHTCLRFYYRSSQSDYIEFTTNADECSSDYVGCKGGRQVIQLGPGCSTRGVH